LKALVFKEDAEQRIMLTLNPEDDRADARSRFSIVALHDDDTTMEHCSGLITREKAIDY
jgi:hypothetical protein